MSHINIPVFVPHLGCPHTCVFCNQHTITGQSVTTAQDIDTAVSETLSLLKDPSAHELQIAFFGGSFTAIERETMLALLEKANYYVQNGSV
ncbi:MAG: radical SAM protein, partial [Clostridia bacterium]|nr:radical SAM protein [Clostridia bacterium]